MNNLKSCIDACLECLITCEMCIKDCINEGNQQCFVLCRDCADISTLCARLEARGSVYGLELHVLCAKVCKACAEECLKHAAHSHCCKECAEACKKCAEICAEHAASIH